MSSDVLQCKKRFLSSDVSQRKKCQATQRGQKDKRFALQADFKDYPKGLSYLTQLRVGLSKLNFHKFKHNFRDTINPMCPTSDGIEDTEHFLLLCPTFDAQRRDLFAGIVELIRPFRQITDLSNNSLTQLLLYGDQDLSTELNRNILELTLRFIHDTGRFD